MDKVIKYLRQNNVQYAATVGLDGKPKVRPFQLMFEKNGKFWFCTSRKKEVYRELHKLPYLELCASGTDLSWLRLSGKVVFSDDADIKKQILEENQLVKNIYKTVHNPDLVVFWLQDVTASISEIGTPPILINIAK